MEHEEWLRNLILHLEVGSDDPNIVSLEVVLSYRVPNSEVCFRAGNGRPT